MADYQGDNSWKRSQQKAGQDWNNFWGGIGNGWNDFWGGVGKAFNPSEETAKAILGAQDPNQIPEVMQIAKGADFKGLASARAQPASSRPLPGLNRTQGEEIPSGTIPGPDQMTPEEARIKAIIDAATGRIEGNQYQNDPMIEQAFGGALTAIANARSKANTNYAASDKVIGDLTQGEVNQIRGNDLQRLQQINSDAATNNTAMYDKLIAENQQRQAQGNAEREAMLKRLGIQESAAGVDPRAQEAAAFQDRLQGDKAAQGERLATYSKADETRNLEASQTAALQGSENRAALRRDLDKILGNLDNSEADVNNQKAMAQLKDKQNQRQQDLDTIDMYFKNRREDQKMQSDLQQQTQKAKGSADRFTVVQDRLLQQGVSPDALNNIFTEYANAKAENKFNQASGQQYQDFLAAEINKRLGGRASVGDIVKFVSLMENYGTDKATGTLSQ